MATKPLGLILIIIICIILFPIAIGIFGALFGLLAGLIGGAFGIIAGVFGAVFGVIAGLFGWVFDVLFDWDYNGYGWNFGIVILLVLTVVLLTRRQK